MLGAPGPALSADLYGVPGQTRPGGGVVLLQIGLRVAIGYALPHPYADRPIDMSLTWPTRQSPGH
jgi:hypothetical protein